MKKVAVPIVFLLSFFAIGQKQVRKTLINHESKSIQIDAENCYKILLDTTEGQEILIDAIIDGEYQKDLIVNIEEEGSNVFISSGFQPNFINPNDKLSAHKVVSIELKIAVPEYMNVHLFGTSTNVHIEGIYRKLRIDLADGICTLLNTGEHVAVKTQNGDIFLQTHSGIVNTKSNYGKVFGAQIPEGNNLYSLRTVEGNIHLSKTE